MPTELSYETVAQITSLASSHLSRVNSRPSSIPVPTRFHKNCTEDAPLKLELGICGVHELGDGHSCKESPESSTESIALDPWWINSKRPRGFITVSQLRLEVSWKRIILQIRSAVDLAADTDTTYRTKWLISIMHFGLSRSPSQASWRCWP